MASIAFDDIPEPDYADTIYVPIPSTERAIPVNPEWWARRVFTIASAPRWVVALIGLRQALVGLFGIEKGDQSVFEVDRVENDEALIVEDAAHLDFRAGVRIDTAHRLLAVTTVVKLHGWRGRFYWAVVRPFHGPITRSMAEKATTTFAAGD
jgi:Protein of unknown function (DUF2867)